jgi:hypothetical protein
VPKDEACAKQIKKLTLTNLYNQDLTWLQYAHQALDEAVFAAYGWPVLSDRQTILNNLVALNAQRFCQQSARLAAED